MRAYMHGYFVDNRLWHKARALAEPFAYDTYRQQRVQQKMEQERKSRIGIVKKLPKVRMKMLHPYLHVHCQETPQGQNKSVPHIFTYALSRSYPRSK